MHNNNKTLKTPIDMSLVEIGDLVTAKKNLKKDKQT